jgi:hypothetical protein
MKTALPVISAAIIGCAAAAAADLPKEGKVDITSCYSGIANIIDFSKTYGAVSYELMGTNRSDPPGGFADMTTFRCVGFTGTIDGKASGMNMCETIDKDGDKLLNKQIVEGPKNTLEMVVGTGKYEGITRTGGGESLGAFPAVKPGTFQGCTHNTGTYKLK